MRGVSSIQRLSVTQLNSEEPFVASVTLVAGAGRAPFSTEEALDLHKKDGGITQGITPGITPGRLLAAGTTAVAESVKRVLARHNIGRNTVEIVLPPGDAPRGAAGSLEGAAKGTFLSSADESRSGHDEAERGKLGGGGGESGPNSHGWQSHGHGHGQYSGHGHAHGHASSVDIV